MGNILSGTGSFIPSITKKNTDFLTQDFYSEKKVKLPNSNEVIIKKFKAITGIDERRYLKDDLMSSDIATYAAKIAIDDAGIDVEQLDYIIVGHNFGNVRAGETQSDFLPSLASRVKHNLKIKKPTLRGVRSNFRLPWLGRRRYSSRCFY